MLHIHFSLKKYIYSLTMKVHIVQCIFFQHIKLFSFGIKDIFTLSCRDPPDECKWAYPRAVGIRPLWLK